MRSTRSQCCAIVILVIAVVLLLSEEYLMPSITSHTFINFYTEKTRTLDDNATIDSTATTDVTTTTTTITKPNRSEEWWRIAYKVQNMSTMPITNPAWENKTQCKEEFKSYQSPEADALWVGDVMGAGQIGNISVVVAHCDKNLEWIWNSFNESFKIHDITIYSKCARPEVKLPSNAKLVSLPNVGRNDHSFAYHMARLEASPSEFNDIVVFWKDNPYRLKDKGRGWDFSEMLRIASVNGFACAVRAQTVEAKGFRGSYPFPAFQPSIYHYYDKWREFRMGRYIRDLGRDKRQKGNFTSNFHDLGAYVDALNLSVPKPYLPVCYGGLFAATKGQIVSTPKSVWLAIEDSLSRASNVIEGHYAERCWAGLLSKPLSLKQVQLIEKKHHCSFCGEAYSTSRCGILGHFPCTSYVSCFMFHPNLTNYHYVGPQTSQGCAAAAVNMTLPYYGMTSGTNDKGVCITLPSLPPKQLGTVDTECQQSRWVSPDCFLGSYLRIAVYEA